MADGGASRCVLEQHLAASGAVAADDLAALVDLRRRSLARHDNHATQTLAALDATDPLLLNDARRQPAIRSWPPVIRRRNCTRQPAPCRFPVSPASASIW